MKSWTCLYCGASSNTGRCPKCGAFFEDKFDDVVDDPPAQTKTFEAVVSQKLVTQIKMVNNIHGSTCRRKKENTVGIKPKPLILGAIIIMVLFAFVQPSLLRLTPQVYLNEPDIDVLDVPHFQLAIHAVWANKSNYNGMVEICDRDLSVERFYMDNGIFISTIIYDTNAILEFMVYDMGMDHFERVRTISFEDYADWEPQLYTGFPVVLELTENW